MIDPMIEPTEADIRRAMAEYAEERTPGWWSYHAHPMNAYTEQQTRDLAKINLMLGTAPNGSLTTAMLERIVDRIAAIEQQLAARPG